MNSWQIRWLSKIAAQQWAGVFINSGLAAVTVPLLHHSSETGALLREALPRLLSHWLMLLISWQTPRDGGSGAGVRTVGSYHVFGSGCAVSRPLHLHRLATTTVQRCEHWVDWNFWSAARCECNSLVTCASLPHESRPWIGWSSG